MRKDPGDTEDERLGVSLFTDGRLPVRPTGDRSRRRRTGAFLLTAGVLGALLLGFVPAPYVIERPGPVFDTLGEVEIEQDSEQVEVPLISIPDQETYGTEGSLSMLTVNVVGNREAQPSWVEVAAAWADPSRAVVPIDAVYPVGQTAEESDEQSAVEMQNSQKDAIAAALIELEYDLESTLTVESLSGGSPADGVLEEGDQILAVNGERPVDVTKLRSIIADNGVDGPASIEVLRDGMERTMSVTPAANTAGDGSAIIGVTVRADYDFPFEVLIQLDRVGGPSAGMMFALGIIDKLTSGALNGGADVAGTGTISVDGAVGGIGGIRQKLYGARDAGSEYFLAPAVNCDEVVGHVPDGIDVVAVETLDEALAALEVLRDGGDIASLPDC